MKKEEWAHIGSQLAKGCINEVMKKIESIEGLNEEGSEHGEILVFYAQETAANFMLHFVGPSRRQVFIDELSVYLKKACSEHDIKQVKRHNA